MADYKEGAVAGTKWNRASRIVIANDLGTVPSVLFVEQEIIALPDGSNIVRDIGNLHGEFDPALEFPIYNPTTGELSSGTATMQQVYELIYSYFQHVAAERDAREAQQ